MVKKQVELTIGESVKDSVIIVGDGNVVGVVNSIYKQEEFSQLVRECFKEFKELLDFWGKTFPAVNPKLELRGGHKQALPNYEEYIEYFKQNNETARLLGEIKNRNPQEYSRFIVAQALDAIGLSAGQIPEIGADTELVKKELSDLKQQQGDGSEYSDNINDPLEYEDRDDLLNQIRHDRKNSHIILHGPSGVGKSYFVQKFQEKNKRDTYCIVIDLEACKPEDVLLTAVKQLSGKERVRGTFMELAKAIHETMLSSPRINRFYFIFENADHNQGAVDELLGPENIIQHPGLIRYLKNWKLFDKIQLKIIIIARHIVEPSKSSPGYSNIANIKLDPLDQDSIQNLFDKIIYKREDLPHDIDLVPELSDEIFYLTGGHPKCAKQMMIALADMGCVRPTDEEWAQLYQEHVVATIYKEMLAPMDIELLSIIWPLSIFRCFDQRLLGGLLERGILPGTTINISRQAHDLRLELEGLSLFDLDDETAMVYTNYAVRNALSFHMQLKAPDRYRMLNARALEIFLDRLQRSESGTEMKVERMAVNLLEILYHWTRLLGMEKRTKKMQSKPKSIQKRIPAAFERYLQLTLTLVHKGNRHDFLRSLMKKWKGDKELQEAVRRASKSDESVQEITKTIKQHDTNWDENE